MGRWRGFSSIERSGVEIWSGVRARAFARPKPGRGRGGEGGLSVTSWRRGRSGGEP